MRVLVAAIACNPEHGSEAYVGWSSVKAIAKNYAVHVITDVTNRDAIVRELGKHPQENLSFSFVGIPTQWHSNRLIARFQSWYIYRQWIAEASKEADRLCRERHFDILHHVTYATWRMGTPFASCSVPLVWGPLGGGETFPLRFLRILSLRSALFELTRMITGWISARLPLVRKSVRSARILLANNRETLAYLRSLGALDRQLFYMSQSFLSRERFDYFHLGHSKPLVADRLNIFAGGTLDGRKGIFIVLTALALLKNARVPFRFVYGGGGTELAHLLRRARRLGLTSQECRLGVQLSSSDYANVLKQSHIYLLPSLREGAPITMLEAMAASCVPVIADCAGAAMLVDDQCGCPIPVTTPATMSKTIARRIIEMWHNPEIIENLGENARLKVTNSCSEEYYIARIADIYKQAATERTSTGPFSAA